MSHGMHDHNQHNWSDGFNDQLHELLAEQALGGNIAELDPEELHDLDRLLGDASLTFEREQLELAAAAVAVGEVERAGVEDMPALLRDRVEAALATPDTAVDTVTAPAADAASRPVGSSDASSAGNDSGSNVIGRIPMSEAEPSTPGSGLSAALGWLAAAAAIAIAAVMFVSGNTGPQPATGPQADAGDATDAEADVAERLAALEQRDDTISSDWNPWPNDPGNPGYAGDASEVSGRVVWNDELQEGYMVFEGLDPNDPSEAQYQLWIVTDGEQEHPVDGGVFDVPDDDRVIVPIDPKLAIQRTPAAFGVTVEKSGGVVVSDQDRRVVVGVPSQDG